MAYSKSGFNLELNTTLNTTQVKKQLEEMQTYVKNKAVIDVQLRNGAKATKEIKTLVDELGNLYRQEQLFSKSGIQLSNKITDVSAKIRTITTETNKWKGANGEINTVISTTNSIGQRFQTRIKEMTDATGKLTKVTQEYTVNAKGQWKKVGDPIKEVSKDEIKLAETAEKARLAQEKQIATTNAQIKSQKSLGQSFVETVGKVAKFYVATIPIQTFMTVLNEAKEAVIEFDKAMIEFQKVSDLRGEALDSYTQKLGEMGKQVARTRTEMLNASTEFKKSGFTDEQSAQLAKIASLYQNIADEELSTADSSRVVISQMKAFGFESEAQAEHIVDAINEVSNNFAVSSGDIGRGLTQAGAALSTYGNSFEETIGLVSAGTEIFQGKSQQVKSCCLFNIA